MRSRIVDLVFFLMLIFMKYEVKATNSWPVKQNEARDFFEKSLLHLMYQRRMFMDGFDNATAIFQREYDDNKLTDAAGEGRGKKKKLRRMNRTLIAIIMAYTLKFMFLIPTFIGTLVLLKFTTALAGFFYALFAAVLGLDRHHDR